MRALLITTLLFLTCTPLVLADRGSAPDPNNKQRFQMLAIGGRAMLLDREMGKTWLLAAKGDKAAWIPIQNLDDSSVASSWLKANLPARKGASSDKTNVSMTEATRQVKLEEITDSEVAAEPFTVLVAREKAELNRLKAEYGDRHPEVMACKNRLRELLKVGAKDRSRK